MSFLKIKKTDSAGRAAEEPQDERKTAYAYIRFSSGKQTGGDSYERQLERAQKYADDHKLRLDDETTLEDLGVSGYLGHNLEHGALAAFVKAVEAKTVLPGTVLIIESLDRLGRDKVLKAVALFTTLLTNKIEIATLLDNQFYTEESVNNNVGQLMISVGVMQRAYEESKTKADRVGSAWGKKKSGASKDIIATTKVPAWLEVVGRRTENGRQTGGKIVVIKERAEVVKQIFQLKKEGLGKRLIKKRLDATIRISKKLKQEKIAAFGRSGVWHDSYIESILHNRAVLGEAQFWKTENGIRVKDGESIPDYYPKIVDVALFNECQDKQKHTRGPAGKRVANLFSELLFDGDTGAHVKYTDKGELSKDGKYRYLYSDSPDKSKTQRRTKGWDYGEFERLFLKHIQEINWNKVAGREDVAAVQKLKIAIEEAKEEIKKIDKRIENLLAALETGENLDLINPRLSTAKEEKNAKLELLGGLESTLDTQVKKRADIKGNRLAVLAQKRDYLTRVRLRAELKKVIKKIELFRQGILGVRGFYSHDPACRIIYQNGHEMVIFLGEDTDQSIMHKHDDKMSHISELL
ncbi:MAG: recombinase family protein [Chthoniobacterales bacterium]|nr:recombinase family protein [Chthoniobacterales bacterium]